MMLLKLLNEKKTSWEKLHFLRLYFQLVAYNSQNCTIQLILHVSIPTRHFQMLPFHFDHALILNKLASNRPETK